MTVTAYQRNSERIELETSVILEDFRTGFYYNGIIYNHSSDGVYLESDYAPRPGRKIYLKVEGFPNVFSLQVYIAEIRWRRPLPENSSSHSYGVGVKYC